jgi:threonine dehydrogenase-like Zn-dependent dehydrogenase
VAEPTLLRQASGHSASLASVFDYARVGGRISMVGINLGGKIPVELSKIQMKNLTVRMYRIARRLAFRHPISRANGNRSIAHSDPCLPDRQCTLGRLSRGRS